MKTSHVKFFVPLTMAPLALAAAVTIVVAGDAHAAARGGGTATGRTAAPAVSKLTTPAVRAAPPTIGPKTAFNRNVFGGASGLKPGMLSRAYTIDNGIRLPGGAQAMGLRSHPFANDGRSGTPRLPSVNARGQQLTYQTTYMRPGGHERASANARLVTGSDGRAYVTRHYQNFKRVQ